MVVMVVWIPVSFRTRLEIHLKGTKRQQSGQMGQNIQN